MQVPDETQHDDTQQKLIQIIAVSKKLPPETISRDTTFEALATFAQYCERPILRETRGPMPAYAVEDDGRLYVYRPEVATPVNRTVADVASSPRFDGIIVISTIFSWPGSRCSKIQTR